MSTVFIKFFDLNSKLFSFKSKNFIIGLGGFTMRTFGERVKQLRLNKGLTQLDLAKKLYVDNSSISKWETKNVIPETEIIKRIAEFFNVTISYLIGDVEQKNIQFSTDSTDIEELMPEFYNFLESKKHSLMCSGEPLSEETWSKLKASLLEDVEFAIFKQNKNK